MIQIIFTLFGLFVQVVGNAGMQSLGKKGELSNQCSPMVDALSQGVVSSPSLEVYKQRLVALPAGEAVQRNSDLD